MDWAKYGASDGRSVRYMMRDFGFDERRFDERAIKEWRVDRLVRVWLCEIPPFLFLDGPVFEHARQGLLMVL